MKVNIMWIIILLVFILGGCSHDFKPTRLIELKEIAVISGEDEAGQYFLKYPTNLKVDHRGNIYVLDSDQFLCFSAQGKFLKNLLKKGQGPGELLSISNYLLQEDGILVHDHHPNKMVKFDYDGNLLYEYRLYQNLYVDLFDAGKDRLYFLTTEADDTKGKGKVIDIDRGLAAMPLSQDKDVMEKSPVDVLFHFPVTSFVYKTPTAFFTVRLNTLKSCRLKDSLFFFSHQVEYKFQLIDIAKKKILKTVTLPYERVKVTTETEKFTPYGQFMYDGQMYRSPRPEFFNDIQALCCFDETLWVFTSTVDGSRGMRVDRFDGEGNYLDCLYLKFPYPDTHYRISQEGITLSRDRLYIIERDKNDNQRIVIYALQ